MLVARPDPNCRALSRRSFFYRSVLAAGGVGALAGNAGFTQVAAAAQDATPASASSTVDPVQTTVPQVFLDLRVSADRAVWHPPHTGGKPGLFQKTKAKSGKRRTVWREMDSNFRYRGTKAGISAAFWALRGCRRGSQTIPPDGSAFLLLRLEPLHR